MVSFIISLIIILGIQFILEFLLGNVMGLGIVAVEITIDLVLAFVFAIFNYRGNKKQAFKDPIFHRNVAIYFVVLSLLTVIYLLMV